MERVLPGDFGPSNAGAAALRLDGRRLPEGADLAEAGSLNGAEAGRGVSGAAEESSTADGELSEFQSVFERYAKPVMAFLRDLLGDMAAAEELTQETFIRAYRARGSKRAETRISTWLFGIAYNVAREAIRDKYRRQNARGLDDPACRDLKDERRSPAQNVIDKETRRAIQAALARLSQAQRIVFVLKVVNQMRYQEITAITGARVGKLKTDLHRARIEMRRMLEPYLRGDIPGLRGDS